MATRHVTISIRTTHKLAAAVKRLARSCNKTRSRYIEDVLADVVRVAEVYGKTVERSNG